MANTFAKYFIEEFHYVADKPAATFRAELDRLLGEQRNTLDFRRLNLTGKFLSDNEFRITRKVEWGTSNVRTGRNMMVLRGRIDSNGSKTDIVLRAINPGALGAVLVPVFLGVLAFFTAKPPALAILLGCAITFGGPILLLAWGYRSKTRLKDLFVETMGLSLIP